MRILLINKFFYTRGGAEVFFFNTAELLRENKHEVSFFAMRHPKNLPSPYSKYFLSRIDFGRNDNNILQKLRAVLRIIYSFEARRRLRALINAEKPDVAYLHNIYHHISPSIIDELKRDKIPVVMYLHDYKMICPAYLLLHNSRLCHSCAGGKYFHVFLKRCVKGSLLKSLLAMTEMYVHHRVLKIYDKVDVFISPSRFLMGKLREMGFKQRVVHLSNFVNHKKYPPCFNPEDNSIVYFGRLSPEKGLVTFIEAVKDLDIKVKIIGEGPQRQALENKVRMENIGNVRFLGYMENDDHAEVGKALFSVLPSLGYENCPRAIIESFALGKPVVGSRIGGIPELVKDFQTGLTFTPGDSQDLRSKISILLNDRKMISAMGQKARDFAERELGPEQHYNELMKIFGEAKGLYRSGPHKCGPYSLK